jgi:hypothetical protein
MWLMCVTVVLASVLTIGCTHGVVDSAPTAPTPPVIFTALTITPVGGGSLLPGATTSVITSGEVPQGVGAFAQFSDGSGHYVEAAWTSSDTAVIIVDGGQLVARGRGTAMLTATYQGKSDTETFTVEGGIAGRWQGTYVVEQCTGSSGSMQEILCNPPGNHRPVGLAAVGNVLPFSVEISENGADLTGVVSFGAVGGTLTGKNRGGGFFYLQGVIEAGGGTVNIVHWDTRVVRDTMEGFIGYQLRLPNLPGFGSVAAQLTEMTRQ